MQKLDRTSIVVILLCIASFAGWQWYMNKNYPQRPKPAAATEGIADNQPATVTEATATPAPEATAAPTPPIVATPVEKPMEQSVYTQSAEYVFSNDSGGLDEVVLYTHYGEENQSIRLNADRTLPVGAVGFSGTETLRGFAMSVSPDNQAVFSHKTEDGLEIIKRFTVPQEAAKNYLIDLEITFRNAGDRELSRKQWFLTTGAAAPVHSTDMPIYTRFEWARDGKMRTTDVNWFSASSVPLLGIPWKEAQSLYEQKTDKIAWGRGDEPVFLHIGFLAAGGGHGGLGAAF